MMDRPMLLVVEDDKVDQMAFERYAASTDFAYDYTMVDSVAAAKEALKARSFDAVVLDYLLGDGTAFDLLADVCDQPTVIVTGTGGEDIAVRALREGVHDYLIKDADGSYLRALPITVQNAISRKSAEDELVQYRMHLEQLVAERTRKLEVEIEERKRVEAEAQRLLHETEEQQRRLRHFLDAVPEGLAVLNSDAEILLANPLAEEYFQVLAHGATVGSVLSHLADVPIAPSDSEKRQWQEIRVPDTPHRIFEFAREPISQSGDGAWILLLREVTKERDIQQRAEEQQRLAAVGQLAAGIAHDFNNILTGMMGYAEVQLINPELPESSQGDMRIILQQGERAAQLIRQILDFSRKSLISKQPLRIDPLLKEFVKLLRRTIPETIRILLEEASGQATVSADPTQLQQVLTNLAVNARDAMPDGGEIRIQVRHQSFAAGQVRPLADMPPGDWVVLSVTDTGTGIPEENLAHLYEPFFTTKQVGQGTGLGLAQVYGIIGQHDGFIDVESEVGKGTTFRVYLPAQQIEVFVEETQQPVELPRGSGETILVVEDEAMVLNVTRAMLESLGYQVLVASNGQQALAIHTEQRDRIDMVLTDLVMPDMGGIQLYNHLKTRAPELKLVFMSGYPLGDDHHDLLGKTPVGWLQKPVLLSKLADVLQATIGGGPPQP